MTTDTPELDRPTTDEAIAALTAAAFEVTDPESQDFGRKIVHRMGSFTGADTDLEGAITTVRSARDVAWVDHWADHDLAVLDADGKLWRFGVKRPADLAESGASRD